MWLDLQEDVAREFSGLSVPTYAGLNGAHRVQREANSPGEMWLRGEHERAIKAVKIPPFTPKQRRSNLDSATRWQKENPEKHREHVRRHKDKHRDEINRKAREAYALRRLDPVFYEAHLEKSRRWKQRQRDAKRRDAAVAGDVAGI